MLGHEFSVPKVLHDKIYHGIQYMSVVFLPTIPVTDSVFHDIRVDESSTRSAKFYLM